MIPYGGTESMEADECRNRGHSKAKKNKQKLSETKQRNRTKNDNTDQTS